MLYVVAIAVDPEVAQDWASWMREHHIPDVLATGCFESAEFLRVTASADPRPAFRIQYRAADQAAIDRYMTEFAERLRADHVARYGGRFSANREVLAPVA